MFKKNESIHLENERPKASSFIPWNGKSACVQINKFRITGTIFVEHPFPFDHLPSICQSFPPLRPCNLSRWSKGAEKQSPMITTCWRMISELTPFPGCGVWCKPLYSFALGGKWQIAGFCLRRQLWLKDFRQRAVHSRERKRRSAIPLTWKERFLWNDFGLFSVSWQEWKRIHLLQ